MLLNRIYLNFYMRKLITVSLSLLFALGVFAQVEQTIAVIGNHKVSKEEFERIYQKNNSNLYNKEDKKNPEQYMELFIDFKLKVTEAENLKMDTSVAFKTELAGYRTELAAPYLTDVSYSKQMVSDLYERTTKEINASHILISAPQDCPREQDQAALNHITTIRNEIVAGKDFGDAAFEYSQDPSAKRNKGNLGYFTAFQMVVPFENAAYSTPVGQISQPVRTSFGWHILKVHGIRTNKGELRVAHIMKIFPQDMTPETKKHLKSEIDSLYLQLKNGADFAALAKTNSDDQRSAQQNGELGWISSGRMIPEITNPAFALEKDGDMSEVVESPYGYHIIKRLEAKPVPSFEDSKKEIEYRIKQDPQRSERSKEIFIEKLKKEYNFTENEANKEKLSNKKIGDSLEGEPFEIFKLDGKSYSTSYLLVYLNMNNIQTGNYADHYNKWVEQELTRYEDTRLEKKYTDFRNLMQEYHDGILLFNISEEKIWNFASKDSAGLEKFYKEHGTKYLWQERFKGMAITCANDSIREEAEKYFSTDMTVNEVIDLINKTGNNISITEGAWEKGANPVVDYYVWNGPEPANFNSGLTFIRGDKIKPEPKTLNEARGLYITDYQKYLEDKWIKELRSKYPVSVDKKMLKTIKGV